MRRIRIVSTAIALNLSLLLGVVATPASAAPRSFSCRPRCSGTVPVVVDAAREAARDAIVPWIPPFDDIPGEFSDIIRRTRATDPKLLLQDIKGEAEAVRRLLLDLRVGDWNGDSRLWLLIGDNGGVWKALAEQTAAAAQQAADQLRRSVERAAAGLTKVGPGTIIFTRGSTAPASTSVATVTPPPVPRIVQRIADAVQAAPNGAAQPTRRADGVANRVNTSGANAGGHPAPRSCGRHGRLNRPQTTRPFHEKGSHLGLPGA